MTSMAATITQSRREVNGVELALLEAGPTTGPLALCLHGFPDTPWGWQPVLEALADAGHHAVAPYLRGYAPSSVPAGGVASLGAYTADANALHEVLGGTEDAVLIGHDWGALTTYGAASSAPQRWSRIVTASIPPASVMGSRMMDYDQIQRFWYQYVFLQPSAEAIVAHDDLRFIERLWQDWSPGYTGVEALARVKDALRDPANLTAAISLYRVVHGVLETDPEFADLAFAFVMPHTQPTLYLHGTDDGCMTSDVVDEALDALPAGSRAERIDGAGHFLQYEQPERVTGLIMEFLAG
jgi:pimeloyl-ACP methyl ester carboxylesterase